MVKLLVFGFSFIALSGLMAAVDAAVLSVTGPEVQELALQHKRGARALRKVKGELTRAVVVIVVLTNAINVIGPIVVSQQAVAEYGTGALGIVTVFLTIGTIVVSEILPKAIGTHYAPFIARFAAIPIRLTQRLLYPFVVALEWLSTAFISGTRPIGTEAQIRSLTSMGRRAGFIERDENRLVHRAFRLNDRLARDIMTPLESVVFARASQSIGDVAASVRNSNYSRFPVFGESADDVVGVAMIRDILEAVASGRSSESVHAIAQPVLTVASTCPSDELLIVFRDRCMHLAVVTDDGRTIGVVTLEDVIEELVGDIEDERDYQAARNRAPR